MSDLLLTGYYLIEQAVAGRLIELPYQLQDYFLTVFLKVLGQTTHYAQLSYFVIPFLFISAISLVALIASSRVCKKHMLI